MAKLQTKTAMAADAAAEARNRVVAKPRHQTGKPGDDAVARLAYQFWLDRGSPEGSADDDWYRAEKALRTAAETAKRGAAKPLSMNAGAST